MQSRFIPTIASQSLGRAWHHKFSDKVAAAAAVGLEAIELFMEDLQYVARDLPVEFPAQAAGTSFEGSTEWQEQQLAAASYINSLLQQLNLRVLCLQPFMHYDGLVSQQEHEARIEELHFWIKMARIVNTDLIQIPSSFLPPTKCTDDRVKIISDLREAAEVGLSYTPTIRFAYEALCWGTHIDRWDDAWEIVKAVDRPNFGTCIDTFNLAGRLIADPALTSGLNADADEELRGCLHKISTDLDISKVFYVEVCDGERLDQPLTSEHEWHSPEQRARMSWSRNARLFPFEERGYLPVTEIFDALCDRGFTGFLSFEIFSRTINTDEPGLPEILAQRAAVSWEKLMNHYEAREAEKTRSRLAPLRREVSQAARL